MDLINKMEQIPSYIKSSDRQFFVLCNYMFVFAFFGHLIFTPIFYKLGNTAVFAINILSIFVDLLCLKLNFKGHVRIAPSIWITWIGFYSLYCIVVFGGEQGYYYYFLALAVIVFFSRWSLSMRMTITAILCLTTVVMFQYTNTHLPITNVNEQAQFVVHALNATANFIAVAYASFCNRRYTDQIQAELLTLANLDPLTGVCNRRSFEKFVMESLTTITEGMNKGAFLLLDIDYFKNINDSYGHAVGDQTLKQVAEVCKQSLREGDILGRIGGEEFAILLKNTDVSAALQIAERIRGDIEVIQIQLEDSTQVSLGLSASIGLTLPRSKLDKLSTIMIRADKALYRAKKNGKNRVIVFR